MGSAPPTASIDSIGLLLIEDDDGDALIVEDLLEDSSLRVDLLRSVTLQDGIASLRPGIDCVLLDLGLPDALGVDSVTRVRAAAPEIAVIVLTGLDNESAGAAAVEAGAQDYLVKGQVDSELLARAIRYAVVRRQAEASHQELRIAQLQAEENARLERGLIPRPIVTDPAIGLASAYRPGRHRALLGGDFYDVVETSDGHLHVLIGDVCGHGPDEAALGASLRIAWRALTLGGVDADALMQTLHRVLEHERQIPHTFATVCTLEIDPDRLGLRMRRAGHPPPILISPGSTVTLPLDHGGPPIGILPDQRWTSVAIALPPTWSLLLYTDGLIEGSVDGGPERLGEERLESMVRQYAATQRPFPGGEALLQHLADRATELNGGDLTDDVAMLLIGTTGG